MYGRCRRWVYGVQACYGVVYAYRYGVLWRCVGTVYGVQALGVRMVYVVCTLCIVL